MRNIKIGRYYHMTTSIKQNFVYKSILTISTYIIGFITFPYVSRILGVEYFGLVNFVDNTINYFLLFATMGISLLGVREIAFVKENRILRNRVFSNILGLNFLFTVLALLIYLICVIFVPQLNQYEELFYIGIAKILFTVFLIEWFFTGMEDFRYITILSILIKTLYTIAVFLFVKQVDDYKLYFQLTICSVVINSVINIIYSHKYVSIHFHEMLSLKYLRQNITLGIYAIMTSMYITFNVMFLGLVSNNTEVGYYTTAFKLYSVVLGFFTSFTSVMLPRMSALLKDGQKEQFQLLIDKSFSIMCTFSMPLILYSMILAPDIIEVLSGSGYEGAISPMRIIMPAIFFVGMAQILAIQILIPMKKDKILLVASILGASMSLLINVLFVKDLKSMGSAIVLFFSEMIVTSTYLFYSLRRHLFRFRIKILLGSIMRSIPIVIVCMFCSLKIANPFISLTISLIIGGGLWGILEYCRKDSIFRKIVAR